MRLTEKLEELLIRSITYIFLISLLMPFLFVGGYVTKQIIEYVTKQIIKEHLISPYLLYLPSFILTILLCIPLKHRIYNLIYNWWYKPQRRRWKEGFRSLGLNLKRYSSTTEAVELLREQIPKIVNTDVYHLLFYNKADDTFLIVDSNEEGGKDPAPLQIGIEDPLIRWIRVRTKAPKAISEIEDAPNFEREMDVFKHLRIELCIPIEEKGKLLGIIALGKRRLGQRYNVKLVSEITRFIYNIENFPYLREFFDKIREKIKVKEPSYTTIIYIKDIPQEILEYRDERILEHLLNPHIRIKIMRNGVVLTEDLNLKDIRERIIFGYIAYKVCTTPHNLASSAKMADPEDEVAKALRRVGKDVPVESGIRQWVGSIRNRLKEVGAEGLIPIEPGRGKGYTIKGMIKFEKEVIDNNGDNNGL